MIGRAPSRAAAAEVGRDLERPPLAAVQQPGVPAVERTGARTELGAADLRRGLRDDVDDAREGVGAVERRAGPADHLDARDVLQRQPGPGVAAAAVEHDRDRHAVDQHQHLRIRQVAAHAADRVDRRIALRRARDVQARHRLEHLVEVGRADRLDVLGGDDGGDRRRARDRHARAGRDADEGLVAEGHRQLFFFGQLGGSGRCRPHDPQRHAKHFELPSVHVCLFRFCSPDVRRRASICPRHAGNNRRCGSAQHALRHTRSSKAASASTRPLTSSSTRCVPLK